MDTEVVAHLIEEDYARTGVLASATVAAVQRLRGTWALAVTAADAAEVVLASHRSPLVVGSSSDAHVAASDINALTGSVDSVQVLHDDIVVLGDRSGRGVPPRESVLLPWAGENLERGAYEDFMEKEIAEQPSVVAQLLERLLPGVLNGRLWRRLDLAQPSRLRFVGCGSSLHASQVIGRTFGVVAGIPAESVAASELDELVDPRSADGLLTVAISPSHDTSDVLRALDPVRGPVLGITSRPDSRLARRCDAVLDSSAGPEMAVAATKTFTSQVVAGSALALSYAAATGALDPSSVARLGLRLGCLSGRLGAAHTVAFPVAMALAEDLAQARSFFYLSRGAGLPYAAEGALKLKETTYRNAEVIPAGEVKHGAIGLIEEGTPVLVLESGDPSRLAGSVAELASRGARIIRVGSRSEDTFPILSGPTPPWGPLESILAFQHLARCLAVSLDRDADKRQTSRHP
jgi:glucosamine--fructose-6-phosphate aminotransferase (isomerizing)